MIKATYRMHMARKQFNRMRECIIIIQNGLIRPIIARKVCFQELSLQIKPRIMLLNQMQRQNKAKVTIWRRLAKRCCPLAIDYTQKVVLVAGGVESGIALKVASDFISDESQVWTNTVVIIADAGAKENQKISKMLRFVGVGTAIFKAVDLYNEAAVKELVRWIIANFGQLDVLVNAVLEKDTPPPPTSGRHLELTNIPKGRRKLGNSRRLSSRSSFNQPETPETESPPPNSVVLTQKEQVKHNTPRGTMHSPFACFQASIEHLRKSNYGIVVNICSTESWVNMQSPLRSKPGLLALTEFISRSFPDIRANSICPVITAYDPRKAEINTQVASVVKFLTSMDSPFMSGQTITTQGYLAEDQPAKRPSAKMKQRAQASALRMNDQYNFKSLYMMMDPSEV